MSYSWLFRLPFLMILSASSQWSIASADTFKFNFVDKPIAQVLETYAKNTQKKMVIDPALRGNATILSQKPVTEKEAFDLLSRALARQGFAISQQEDVLVVMSAREVNRSKIEVSKEVPNLSPERMVTWVADLKSVTAESVLKNLRILPSRDGELSTDGRNRIILTDWVSNIARVAEVIAAIDEPKAAKK